MILASDYCSHYEGYLYTGKTLLGEALLPAGAVVSAPLHTHALARKSGSPGILGTQLQIQLFGNGLRLLVGLPA